MVDLTRLPPDRKKKAKEYLDKYQPDILLLITTITETFGKPREVNYSERKKNMQG